MNFLSNFSFDTPLQYEAIVRIAIFGLVLIFMLALEYAIPKKPRQFNRRHRWPANLSLIVIDTFILRLVFPIAPLAFASYSASNSWGIFNFVHLPAWLEIIISIVLLDMLIYWQHVASHKIPTFWSFHKIHHGDLDLDVTTGIRFHPVEICLSMLYKFFCILILGPAVIAVFIFEIILNASALFNHSNIRIPKTTEKLLRLFIVTPDMHRIHHSVIPDETNSNYGFNLSIWDKVFGSYISQPSTGHQKIVLGLSEYQSDKPHQLRWCLFNPFKRKKSNT